MNASSKRRHCIGAAGIAALLLSGCAAMQPAPPAPSATDPSAAETAAAAAPVDDPQARYAAAMQLWQEHKPAEAEAALRALTVDYPRASGPWTNLGILYAKSKRSQQAVGALQRAVALDPSNGVAYNWLGILYREQREYARALEAYRRALAIDPDHALAHYNLAILYDAHLRQPAEALPHYRAYQRLKGTDELRVAAWIAAIESSNLPAAPPAPANVDAAPAAAETQP